MLRDIWRRKLDLDLVSMAWAGALVDSSHRIVIRYRDPRGKEITGYAGTHFQDSCAFVWPVEESAIPNSEDKAYIPDPKEKNPLPLFITDFRSETLEACRVACRSIAWQQCKYPSTKKWKKRLRFISDGKFKPFLEIVVLAAFFGVFAKCF